MNNHAKVTIVAAVIGAVGVISAALITVYGSLTGNISLLEAFNRVVHQTNKTEIVRIIPQEVNLTKSPLTSTPEVSPTSTEEKDKRINLSEELLYEKEGITFLTVTQEIIINNKLYESFFELQGSRRIAFKLDKKQKKLILKCGIEDNKYTDSFSLKIFADGKEVLSQGYERNKDPVQNELDIPNTQLLIFKTNPYATNYLYCIKGELEY